MSHSPPPSSSFGTYPLRASPLKRSRPEGPEDAQQVAAAATGPSSNTGAEGPRTGACSPLALFHRPQFPPPPPPPPPPQSPNQALSALGNTVAAEEDDLSGPVPAPPRAPAVVSLSPVTHTAPPVRPQPVVAAMEQKLVVSERCADGQRKVNKWERVEAVRSTERTPSRHAAQHHSEAPESELADSRSTQSSSSWSSFEDSSEQPKQKQTAQQSRSNQGGRPPVTQPEHGERNAGNVQVGMVTASVDIHSASPHPLPAREAVRSQPEVSCLSTLTNRTSLSSSKRSGHNSSTCGSSRSSSSSSSTTSSSSSSRSSSSAADKEDRAKHYPRFTTEYANTFAHDLVPFMCLRHATPATSALTSHLAAATPSPTAPPTRAKSWISNLFGLSTPASAAAASHTRDPRGQSLPVSITTVPTTVASSCPNAAKVTALEESRLVLYNKYVYQRTLGKGTFSKVVAAQPLSGTDLAEPAVALKVFRDEDVYREACWDEVTILNTLCQCFAAHTTTTTATTVASSNCASGSPHACTRAPVPVAAVAPTMVLSPDALLAVAKGLSAGDPSASSVDPVIYDGRFLAPLGYIPHPVHPAILYPILGPSLLHVIRIVKKESRQRAIDGREKEKARAMAAATALGRDKGLLYLRGLPLPLLRAVLFQVLQCLCFMHEYGVVHTDLKPENILFESTENAATDVPVFALNLNAPCSSSGYQDVRADQEAQGTASATVSHRKSWNDTAKLHSARSSLHRGRTDDSFPSFPSLTSGPDGVSTSGFEADPRFSNNRRLQHTLTLPMPRDNGVRVVDLGSARLTSRFRYACRYDDVCLASPSDPPPSASGKHHGKSKQAPQPQPQPQAQAQAQQQRGRARTTVSYEPIQTSHYRSPEVILDLGWNTSADIFSLGCMIPELVAGDCLFMPNDTFEHLAMLEHVIGPFFDPLAPVETRRRMEHFLRCNPRTFAHYFDKSATDRVTSPPRVRWPVTAEDVRNLGSHASAAQSTQSPSPSASPPQSASGLFSTTIQQDVGRHASDLSEPVVTARDDIRFVREKPNLRDVLAHCPALLDLVEKMVRFHPHDRITAAEALRHPFFQL